jgi:hypothetical protein
MDTSEDKETSETVVRAVVKSTAALALLDAANACRNSRISPDKFAEITVECLKLADTTILPYSEFQTKAQEQVQALNDLFPQEHYEQLTSEQKKKMI